jgi:hypothetical protein
MNLSDIKELLQRIQKLMQSTHPKDQKSYLYENYDDGFTVTWRFANARSPQQVLIDVQTAAVWLWSLKDYLKERLVATGDNPNDVESHVNGCRYLPVLADVANGAKHAKLTRSRSGRFARLGACSMAVRTAIRLEAVQDGDADVQVTLGDPKCVSYKLRIVDQKGRYVGDGLVLLREALAEWRRFIRKNSDLKVVL